MSPPISKEWWLAAALTSASVPAALGQPATTGPQRQVGVVTSVKAGAVTYAPLIGDGTRDLPITNDTDAPMHVMFTDQSAVTIGPKSAMVIKLYEHDSQKKSGNVLIELTQGLMRYVGGQISKRSGAQIRTATATIGIRGGISTVGVTPNNTNATFLFGQQMRVTDNSGNTQNVNRPGFGTTIALGGLGPVTRTDPNTLRTTNNQLGGPPPTTKPGPPKPPGPPVPTTNVANNTNNLFSTSQVNTFTNPNAGGGTGGTKTLRETTGGGNPITS